MKNKKTVSLILSATMAVGMAVPMASPVLADVKTETLSNIDTHNQDNVQLYRVKKSTTPQRWYYVSANQKILSNKKTGQKTRYLRTASKTSGHKNVKNTTSWKINKKLERNQKGYLGQLPVQYTKYAGTKTRKRTYRIYTKGSRKVKDITYTIKSEGYFYDIKEMYADW